MKCIDQFKLGVNLYLTGRNETSGSIRMGPIYEPPASKGKMCLVRSFP